LNNPYNNNGSCRSPIHDTAIQSSPSMNNRIVFDQDGNLLKSFDYSEEILYKKENYDQANFEINLSDINKNFSNKMNDPNTNRFSTVNTIPSSFIKNDYSIKSYLSNEKSNSDTSKSNKLPSVTNGYIIKNKKPSSHKNSGKNNEEKDKQDRPIQKLEKINTNTNMVYNNRYQPTRTNPMDKMTSNNKKGSSNETILQPLYPLNYNNNISNGFDKKKMNNNNINNNSKQSEYVNPYSSNNTKINQFDLNLSKPTSYKTSRINSLLNDFKNGDLIDSDIFKKEYLIRNHDFIENNNINNNKKLIRESLMKIEEKNKINTNSTIKQLQNQSISRNSIMYLQNEEANEKAKNNFKSWIITNYANEWENQPWISIKCPEYNEWEKGDDRNSDDDDYYDNNYPTLKRKANTPNGITENLPLKIAFLSQTIKHIYKNSSK